MKSGDGHWSGFVLFLDTESNKYCSMVVDPPKLTSSLESHREQYQAPLFFFTYINDLPEAVDHSDSRLFADDCLVYRIVKSDTDAMRLHEDLAALDNLEKLWQMQFHTEKCQVKHINNNKRFERQTEYKLHGHTLEALDSWKYLGVQHRRRVDRLTTLFKIQVEIDTDAVRSSDRRTRGHYRLHQPAAIMSVYKYSFFPKTIREWNLLPTQATYATILEEFRVGLVLALPTLRFWTAGNRLF